MGIRSEALADGMAGLGLKPAGPQEAYTHGKLNGEKKMANELERLLAASRERSSTPAELEEQRRSFAYGNTHFENEHITRDTVDRAAEDLKAKAADAADRHPTR